MKKYLSKQLKIADFSSSQNSDHSEYSLEDNAPRKCFNVRSVRGALVAGKGLSHLKLPISQTSKTEREMEELSGITFTKIWRYKYYSNFNGRYEYVLVAFGSDKTLYFTNIFFNDDSFHTLGETLNGEPVAINFVVDNEEVIGFSSKLDDFLVWYSDEMPSKIASCPKFRSICLHKGRLFVIDAEKDNLVRFSGKTDPTLWTTTDDDEGAGSIEMNDYKGELRALLSFGDYVYVFRDFGISKITSYSSSSIYYASNVYSSSHKIYHQTACVCGDKIYFLQDDGLYEFDGSNVKRVDLKFSNMLQTISQESANTCFYDGKLYLACALNFADDLTILCENGTYKNNCLVEFDPKTKEYNITRGVDICCMLGIKDLLTNKLVVLQNGSTFLWQLNDTGDVEGTDLIKLWESKKITLGSFSRGKLLREIKFKCNSCCDIKITSDRRTKVFSLSPNSKITRVVCNVPGKEFSLSISSADSTLNISNLEMTFDEEMD